MSKKGLKKKFIVTIAITSPISKLKPICLSLAQYKYLHHSIEPTTVSHNNTKTLPMIRYIYAFFIFPLFLSLLGSFAFSGFWPLVTGFLLF